jgi:hypothetical protein
MGFITKVSFPIRPLAFLSLEEERGKGTRLAGRSRCVGSAKFEWYGALYKNENPAERTPPVFARITVRIANAFRYFVGVDSGFLGAPEAPPLSGVPGVCGARGGWGGSEDV